MPILRDLLSRLLIGAVWLYQHSLGLILPRTCRYQPSCSQYFIEAVRKYGPLFGAWRGIKRICRCHPWNAGGYDPP